MPRNSLVIGSRGSRLALWQSNRIKELLEYSSPGLDVGIKIIETTGDKMLNVALSNIGDKGLFTRQIENELLAGTIDLAVHSLKDLETRQPDGLKIGAVTERELPNDVLITNLPCTVEELPENAKVATGSLRRRSQLLNLRPDLEILEIRGNVPTRLQKLESTEADALILAYAGVHRLGLDDHITQIIPFEVMLPAVGQGAIAVEIRADDLETEALAMAINDEATFHCTSAERAFLRELEGGCQVPVAAHAVLENDEIRLDGMVGSFDGRENLRKSASGPWSDPDELGIELAREMIDLGAGDILQAVRDASVERPREVI
ncbi:MAG TPA: hydroxymethylbilane synthase [Aridibacter sp.]|nr:hydroxymethylbilane synthase [Aridibacter sp.]